MFINQELLNNVLLSASAQLSNLTPESRASMLKVIRVALIQGMNNTWSKMDISQKTGPSIWEFLHWMAAVADREHNPVIYHNALETVCQGHPCAEKCRPHIRKALISMRPESYPSMLEHSVAFHNVVNARLGKPIYSIVDARTKYGLECDSCTFTPTGK